MMKGKPFSDLTISLIKAISLNTAVIFGFITSTHAQISPDSFPGQQLNAISIHLLGDGSILSGSYERMIPIKTGVTLSARAGLGYTKEFQVCVYGPCQFSSVPARLTIVHTVTANLGGPRFYLEAGLGGNIIKDPEGNLYLPYMTGGIRWHTFGIIPFVLRAYYNHGFFDSNGIIYAFVPLGLSIGVRF